MRIVAGEWKGRALAQLGKGAPGDHLRPTSDRVRESLFNVILHGRIGVTLEGIRVLDLFAGTGALGFEALSRGAAQAVFLDNGRTAGRLISENIALLKAWDRATHLTRDACRPGANIGPGFDLVFLDPPYGKFMGQTALKAAREGGWIGSDALIVWEENAPQSAPPGFLLLDQRKFGDTHVTFLKAGR